MSSAESQTLSEPAALKRPAAEDEHANGSDAKRPLLHNEATDEDPRQLVEDSRSHGYKRWSTRELAAPNELSEQERSFLKGYLEVQAELFEHLREPGKSDQPSLDTVFGDGRKCVVEELAVQKDASESYVALTVSMDAYGNGMLVPCTAVFKPRKEEGQGLGMIFYMIDYGDPMAYSGGERCDPMVISDLRRALMMPSAFDLEVTNDKHCEDVSELTDMEKKLLLAAVKHHRMDDDVVDSSTTVEMLFGNDDFMDDSMCQFYYFQEVAKFDDAESTRSGRVYVRVGFGMGGSDHSTVFEDGDDDPLFTCVDSSDFGWAREGRGESKEDEELIRAFKYFIGLQSQDDYEEDGEYIPPEGHAENPEGDEDDEDDGEDDDEEDEDDDGGP